MPIPRSFESSNAVHLVEFVFNRGFESYLRSHSFNQLQDLKIKLRRIWTGIGLSGRVWYAKVSRTQFSSSQQGKLGRKDADSPESGIPVSETPFVERGQRTLKG